ncbi:MAG: TlpA family protein disulfide reductase [Acidobacteriaceae bacterium]|nr:TlpA family protein disulfide reductase [Acidobacteriaceae bacterium]
MHTGYKSWVSVLAVTLSLSVSSFADLVRDVRIAIAQNNLSAAEAELQGYQGQHDGDPEYLEAASWLARGYLSNNRLDQAQSWAKQVESSSRQLLVKRKLDAEPHLPQALGAAIEVEAQTLALRGQNAQAVALLRRDLATYRGTSIQARLQKNVNMMGLAGQPAPPLNVTKYIGVRPATLADLKGSPVLLFFWAHWCSDCKQEAPIIGQLNSEFASQGLKVEAPTQYYGYAAYGQEAAPADEFAYIGRVWQHYYPALQDVPVPVNKLNFDKYGASTTPTLVLIDRKGRVALYHPGFMPYEDLRAAVQRAM